jgi:hypothetical protein
MTIGKRFHSEAVVRLGDAKPVHLGHTISADGRWRIFAFADAGDPSDAAAPLARLCEFLGSSPDSPVVRYTPVGADVDSVIDVRAVCQQYHRDLALESLPSFLLPRKGPLGLVDYEKIFCPDLSVRRLRQPDDLHSVAWVAIDEDDVGGFDGYVGSGTDGNAYVGSSERGRVIDAVARHGNDAALLLELLDVFAFCVRQHLGDDAIQPKFFGYPVGHFLLVARQHHHFDAHLMQRADGFFEGLSDDIG